MLRRNTEGMITQETHNRDSPHGFLKQLTCNTGGLCRHESTKKLLQMITVTVKVSDRHPRTLLSTLRHLTSSGDRNYLHPLCRYRPLHWEDVLVGLLASSYVGKPQNHRGKASHLSPPLIVHSLIDLACFLSQHGFGLAL